MSRVLPLRVELADLKDTLKEKEKKITNLEGRSVTREVHLGKVEGELAACQEALKEKTEALAAHVEKAKEVEAELLTDGTEAYGAGFEDALTQVACKHLEVDVAFFTPDNYVADGNIVPRPLNLS